MLYQVFEQIQQVWFIYPFSVLAIDRLKGVSYSGSHNAFGYWMIQYCKI